jgi:hypothetical protein
MPIVIAISSRHAARVGHHVRCIVIIVGVVRDALLGRRARLQATMSIVEKLNWGQACDLWA